MNNNKFSWRTILHIISKILSWALFVILLLIAVFLLYYYIANKNYIKKGSGYEPKFSIYTIATGSMVPNINVLDAVINMRVDNPADLKVGDVITFRSSSVLTNNLTITHRIKAITKDEEGNVCYITKGDANNIEDDSCAKFNNIIGKVIIRIPGLGHIQWLSNIKDNASMMNKKKNNPKKEAAEKKRKEQIKRNLLNENKENKEYYKEPTIKTIEKKTNNSKQKRKKK